MNFRVSLVNLLTAAVAAGIVASALWAADNLTIKEPTTPSATVRSDDVGGVHYQGFKIYDGEADSATPLELTPAQDYDTGGGTANLTGFGLLLPASGGPVPGGTVTAPLRVDPTGATAQPVTDNGGSLTVDGPLTDAQLRASAVPVDSELPAGVTPADNQTNAVTIPLVGGFAYVFDGATWDRWTGAVTISGTPTVTANAGSGTFLVGDGAGALTIDGTVSLGAAIPAGTNNIGDVDVLTVPAPLSTAGGGTEATALRVTVANDSTGVLSVDDNGGSLTVDGTVAVSGTVTVDTEFANQTDGAAVGATGIQVLGTDGTNAQIIKTDASGAVQIDCESGCGGGTQFAEDAGHTTGDLGTMALAVRNDAGGALAGATGDYIPLTTDASGALRVTGGGGGTEVTEDVASAADPTGGQIMLRRRDTLAAETTTDGDVVAGNATNKGELYVKHVDAIPVTDNGGSLTIDAASLPLPTGASTLAEQQTQTTALQIIDDIRKNEDDASANLDPGVVLFARRTATPANTSGADLDYEALQMAGGRLWTSTTIDAALPAGTNNIGDIDVLTLPSVTIGTFPDNEPVNVAQMNGVAVTMGNGVSGTGVQRVTIASDSTGSIAATQATASSLNAEVQGDAAHDAAVSGNPVLGGLYSETAEDTAPGNQVSAEAEAVRAAASRDGAQYVLPYGPRIWEVSEEYTTQQTDTTLKAAPGAGLSFHITDISIYCNGAVTVTIEDDEPTDDLLHRYYCAGAGDGNERHLSTPIKTGANQALFVTTSAAVTVFVGVSGHTGP